MLKVGIWSFSKHSHLDPTDFLLGFTQGRAKGHAQFGSHALIVLECELDGRQHFLAMSKGWTRQDGMVTTVLEVLMFFQG